MQQRSTNLITVPIQDNSAGNSNDYWTPTNKVPPPNMHQPPPNFYHRPPHPQGHQQPQGQHQQHPQPQNQHYAQVNTGASGSHPPAGSYNEWSANSRTNSSGYHRRWSKLFFSTIIWCYSYKFKTHKKSWKRTGNRRLLLRFDAVLHRLEIQLFCQVSFNQNRPDQFKLVQNGWKLSKLVTNCAASAWL